MQSSRNLVVFLVELAAGVELGHDQLKGGNPLGGVDAHRYASAVILDPDYIVALQHDDDVGAVARQGFVDGVVHHLVDQVVEAVDPRGADVHARALAHRLEPLENLNAIRRVV